MVEVFYGTYTVLCAVCYVVLRIALTIVLVFLFVTTVSALAKFVERLAVEDGGAVAGARNCSAHVGPAIAPVAQSPVAGAGSGGHGREVLE